MVCAWHEPGTDPGGLPTIGLVLAERGRHPAEQKQEGANAERNVESQHDQHGEEGHVNRVGASPGNLARNTNRLWAETEVKRNLKELKNEPE